MSFKYLLLDLDGTLYPHNNGLWDQIAARMELYMKESVGIPERIIPTLREEYYQQFGTTLAGLRKNYPLDEEEYLDFVHDVDLGPFISFNPTLRQMLVGTTAKKWIFTNASIKHAIRVLKQIGIDDLFDGIIDITSLDYHSKPNELAYHIALNKIGSPHPAECLFVDDIPKNLAGAKRVGIQTVLVGPKELTNGADYQIDNICQLRELLDHLGSA
jgi:putative hydrolase of the HAD superfamily